MLSTEIREATKEAHQALEKEVVLRLKNIRSNAGYAALLKFFYAYFNSLEQQIRPYITPDILPDYGARRNAAFLKNDIEALGSDTTGLPSGTTPEIKNHLQALGALYVMEGSIMGGGIIVKMLEKAGVTQGVSFFSGYGGNTPQMWSAFTAALNAQANGAGEKETVIRTANQTFSHFRRMFELHPEAVS
jgi:heme oxygenase